MRSRSWSNLVALLLAFTAFAIDQVLFIWSVRRTSVCFGGENLHGTLWRNLFFAAPFILLVLAQTIQLRLPVTRARNAAGVILSFALLAYIVFSIAVWPEDGWLYATKNEITACYNNMDVAFVHNALHLLLLLPCGLFLLMTLAIGGYLAKTRR
jgi:hypothetical protein